MIISFDIDNTLIPYTNEFEVRQVNPFFRMIGVESLREGTTALFEELEKRNHQIWIYTTSFRSVFNLKKTFRANGLEPKKYINQKINQKKLKQHQCGASKNPKLFGINIHIDDAKGVELEGEKYGFKTIIVNFDDSKWSEKIITRIKLEEANL